MRTMKIVAVLLPLISLFSTAQLPQATMKGIVAREDGRAVIGAFVIVVDYQRAGQEHVSHKWETRTEAGGSFAVVMEPGCYDIFVSGNAQSLPFSRRLCF